jgi:hypothetical protein
MITPKAKVPALRQLTNDSYSSNFINSAWKGYSKEVDDKYGFSFALEWYIESNLVDAIEFKVLNASTCLELLMDKFTSQTKSEGIVDKKIFRQFRKSLKSYIHACKQYIIIERTINQIISWSSDN